MALSLSETKNSIWIEFFMYFGRLVIFDLLFITNEIVNVKLKCPTFKKKYSPIIGGHHFSYWGVAVLPRPPVFYAYGDYALKS